MKGHLGFVIDRAFSELWQPLTDHDDCPTNVFGEIYNDLRRFLKDPEPQYRREDDGAIRDVTAGLDSWASLALNDSAIAEELLIDLSNSDFASESSVLSAVSSTYSILGEVATDELANRYLYLLRIFVERYSLGYYVDDKARLWSSFPGLMASYFEWIKANATRSPHIYKQLSAFEHMLAESVDDPIETRILTTIQKQCNLLEAMGSSRADVDGNNMGSIADQIGTWPHENLKEAAKRLYGFASDFPGLRHGGTEGSDVRDLDLRDLIGVTLSLTGLVAYFMADPENEIMHAVTRERRASATNRSAEAPWIDSSNSKASQK